MRLDSYFKAVPKLQEGEGMLSKRVQQAVYRLGRANVSERDKNDPISQPRTEQTVNTRPEVGETKGRGKSGSRTVCDQSASSGEFIPQRECDKINALKRKLKAVEVLRNSKTGLNRSRRQIKCRRQELKEAKLSESSSGSE
jgi:hypothetical protein